MKPFLYTWLLIALFSITTKGQTPPQLIPQSPAAYSLGKYGDIPVSYYTGVPDISIPVCTLKDHNASVDISLSYHGSGIKVDEQASFVGLGWSLNAGGVITRNVRGRAESLSSSGQMIPVRTNITFHNIYVPSADNQTYITDNNLNAAAGQTTDNEPDEYFFNFNGRSGKFVFDASGSAILEKQEALDIKWQYVSPDVQKFIIKDEFGVVYEFSDIETTNYGGNDNTKISAWFLSKITTASNNVINFEYYSSISSDNYSRSYATTLIELSPAYADITPPTNAIYFSTSGMTEVRLRRITCAAGSVELKYKTTNRLDYYPRAAASIAWTALDSIIVIKPDNSIVKKTKIFTSYFESNNIRKYNGADATTLNFLNYRLRLDSIQDFSAQGSAAQPPYKCFYLGDSDPGTDDPYTLPYRLSPQQDHWGYYNQSNNTHLFPGNPDGRTINNEVWLSRIQGTVYDDQPVSRTLTNGANREPNTEGAKAGMLNKLVYPTGGFTVFDFESNAGNNCGGLHIKKITSNPLSGNPVETSYSYGGSAGNDPRNFYYKLYSVYYHLSGVGNAVFSPVASAELLQNLGLPSQNIGAIGENSRKFVKITAAPQALLGSGSQIGFSSVVVSQTGNGQTVYAYDAPGSYPDYTEHEGFDATEPIILDNMFNSEYVSGYDYSGTGPSSQNYNAYINYTDWPYPSLYSNSWKRGVLIDKYVIREDGTSLRAEHNIYHKQLISVAPGYTVRNLRVGEFVFSKSCTAHAWVFLDSSTVIDYDKNGLNPLTTTTKYRFDNTVHLQPTRVETIRSDGSKQTTAMIYPMDYSAGTVFIDNMNTKHVIASPIEKIIYLDKVGLKTVLTGTITKYMDDGSGLPKEQSVLEIPGSTVASGFKFSNRSTGIVPPAGSATTFAKDDRYKSRLQFIKYDDRGNPLELMKTNDLTTSYIWGYNKLYPVAEIKLLPYDHAVSVINQTVIQTPSSDEALRTELNKIRANFPAAFITSYTYSPLIGITSETDPAGKTTYYEYDTFNRLKNIKDYQGNIVKNFQYNYTGGCGNNCAVLPMQTFNGSNTIGYPVGVFNVNGLLLGNATTQAQYISMWNANAANQAKGVLSAGTDVLHFNLALATGQTAPTAVTGLRYYQFDLAYNVYDGVTWNNCDYVDFGDGTSMRMGQTPYDASIVLAPNTYRAYYPNLLAPSSPTQGYYLVHNYANSNTKKLTMYHSDDIKNFELGNGLTPATSMTKVSNLTGNIQQYTSVFGGSSIQSATYWSVAGITNWNSINSIKSLFFNKGDGVTVCTNTNFSQDFMANNKGLIKIYCTDGTPYVSHIRDLNFKLSKLKSDWNTYFTNLEYISVSEDNWNHENLSGLTKLNAFGLMATNQNHSNDPTNNPVIPLLQPVIDNVFIQIAAGAGQTVSNGVVYIQSGGTSRSAASNAAVAQLKAKGWTINYDGVLQ